MDLTLDSLGPWIWTLCFSAVLYPLTGAFRKLLELIPKLKGQGWWENAVLPVIPAVLGLTLALAMKKYPFPFQDPPASVRAITGLLCGFLSAYVYRGVKAWIKSKSPKAAAAVEVAEPATAVVSDPESDPPPPPSGAG